jgi:hypothetical protein
MKSAQYSASTDDTGSLNRARNRRILVQGSMRSFGEGRARGTRDRTYRGYLVRGNPRLQLQGSLLNVRYASRSDQLPLCSEMTRWAATSRHDTTARMRFDLEAPEPLVLRDESLYH